MAKIKICLLLEFFLCIFLFVCFASHTCAQYMDWRNPLSQDIFPQDILPSDQIRNYSLSAINTWPLYSLTQNPLLNEYRFPSQNPNSFSKNLAPFSNNYTFSSINTLIQFTNTPYYSSSFLWGNSHLQGLKITTPMYTCVFPQIDPAIWLQNTPLYFYWFDDFKYPTFYNPISGINLSFNSFWWGYPGIYIPSKITTDYLAVGYSYFQNGEYDAAIEALKKAIDMPYSELAKIQGYFLLGMSFQSLGINYLEEAEKYLEIAASLEVNNTKFMLELAKVYYQQGKYINAIKEYGRVVERDPENFEAIKGLAFSYFKANELTMALKALQKAEMMDPSNPEILYTAGIVFEEKHLFIESTLYFNRVIDLDPESAWASQAREHIQGIELSGGVSNIEDLEEEKIKTMIMTAPTQEDLPDNSVVILLNNIYYKVLPDDTLIYTNHKLVKILNEKGKEASEIKVSYDSSYQDITIDLARVIKPDGTIIGAKGEDIQEVSPWVNFPFYSNTKVLIISMHGVTVGSVLEYKITIEEIPGSKLFPRRQIDAGFTLASAHPVLNATISVSAPYDLEFEASFINAEPLEPEIVLNEGIKNYIWELKNNIPPIIIEPMMPPLLDITPILFVTSYTSWKIIADWWRELEFQAIIPDDAIRSEVEQLTKGLYTQKDKARAIYHYVASQIRYVGLEYGKGGFNPHSAVEVYKNKYGDCKNKSILLITMLREKGIQAYPVLISTVGNGRVWQKIPRLRGFNHVITLCIIDDEWIWLDPTVATCPFEESPGEDQDRDALVIFDDGYSLVRTPVVSPEKNLDQETLDVTILDVSSAMIYSATMAKGINAIYSRNFFMGLDQFYRRQHLETVISERTTGGGILTDFTLSKVEDLNEPYKLELNYTDPYYIEWAGDIGLINATYLSPNKAAIANEERLHPVFLNNTSIGESFTYITLPENLEILYLPPPITLEIPEILFMSEYTLNNNTITYYFRYEIKSLYVPIEGFIAYKRFQEEVDRELKRKIIFQRN